MIADLNAPAVLLFRGRGLFSALIRWQTRGKYAHAAILMPDGKIVESWQGDAVRVKFLKDWNGVERYAVPSMTDAQWQDAIAFALAEVGKRYNYWAISRYTSRRRGTASSELVFEALEYGGVRLFERVNASKVSPSLLAISPLLVPVRQPFR